MTYPKHSIPNHRRAWASDIPCDALMLAAEPVASSMVLLVYFWNFSVVFLVYFFFFVVWVGRVASGLLF